MAQSPQIEPIYKPGGGSDIPPTGVAGEWPTAAAINSRIATSEKANNRTSPLRGLGMDFIELGRQYGINPGIVCAILQRESQLGCDGTILPAQCNNFSGITYGDGNAKCEPANGIHNRDWSRFSSPRKGLEGTFKLLNTSMYRATGGKLTDIMNLYSPAYENDWQAMFTTFAAVGSQLGIRINAETNIYTNAGTPGTDYGQDENITNAAGNWVIDGMKEGVFRFVLIGVGGIGLFVGVRGLVNTHAR